MEIPTKEKPQIVPEGVEVKIRFEEGEHRFRYSDGCKLIPQRIKILLEKELKL